MPIFPIIRDDNGNPLIGRGCEIVTKRFSGIDKSGQPIALGIDVKECVIHIEGDVEVARFTGTVSGSEQVRITKDGLTLAPLPVVKEAGEPIVTVAAPSGSIDLSVIGWR